MRCENSNDVLLGLSCICLTQVPYYLLLFLKPFIDVMQLSCGILGGRDFFPL